MSETYAPEVEAQLRADAAAIVTAVNTLFANLRTAGVMAAK